MIPSGEKVADVDSKSLEVSGLALYYVGVTFVQETLHQNWREEEKDVEGERDREEKNKEDPREEGGERILFGAEERGCR